jgi:NADH:ubiquinone oxidoreductase subunit F (NADH-binding)
VREAGYLGERICGQRRAFDMELRLGAGAYICGEETSLLESLEGKRGVVRAKPPLPAIAGLFGQPTVVNNVISLATVPVILARGAPFYRDFGLGRSRGTLAFQLAGNIARPGWWSSPSAARCASCCSISAAARAAAAAARGAGGRTARRLSARGTLGYAHGLRGFRGRRGDGGARRHRGFR